MLYTILANPDGLVNRSVYQEYIEKINTRNLIDETNKLVTEGKLTTEQGKIINSLLKVYGIVKGRMPSFIFGA